MLATASCHNASAVQSDLGKGRHERKFWCALIRMKQSLFMSGFHVRIHFSCRDFVSGFTFHVGISCQDSLFMSGFRVGISLRVGISFFVSGFHSSCRDLEHQYLPFSASIASRRCKLVLVRMRRSVPSFLFFFAKYKKLDPLDP